MSRPVFTLAHLRFVCSSCVCPKYCTEAMGVFFWGGGGVAVGGGGGRSPSVLFIIRVAGVEVAGIS